MGRECVFLSDKEGGYFVQDGRDFSQYQGLFHFLHDEWELYKTIDEIRPLGVTGTPRITLQDGFFERETQHVLEKFWFSGKSLVYEVDGANNVMLYLDFRRIHDYDDKGRIYHVTSEKDVVVVEYKKYEDDGLKALKETKYLAIKGIRDHALLGEWEKKEYEYDRERGARHELYVYRALSFVPVRERVVFGFGETKKDAVRHATRKIDVPSVNLVLSEEVASAALRNLMVDVHYGNTNVMGIFAGYPWFYQFWGRDECISLIGLVVNRHYMLAKHIIMRLVESLDGNGCLHNRWPESELKSADATGWLFKRVHQLLAVLEKEGKIKEFFSRKELEKIYECVLVYSAYSQKLLNPYTGLVMNGPKETWMDTADGEGKDMRSGARVEIQALMLAAYDFAEYLRNLLWKEKTLDFVKFREELVDNTRRFLFRDGMLWDGYDHESLDRTVRPNVFLAYYVYQNLLFREEWINVFRKVIDACWLSWGNEWGGFSSIDKGSPLMRWEHTGMNNESYHRGDSWLYLNNIAAACMHRLDGYGFREHVKKIRAASVAEMNTMGFIGQCAELSSAKELSSKGALAQAWSAATLIELLHELGEE